MALFKIDTLVLRWLSRLEKVVSLQVYLVYFFNLISLRVFPNFFIIIPVSNDLPLTLLVPFILLFLFLAQ
jgi:hypothetical protein